MNKEEKQPNVYMIPKNSFDTGYVFGGAFKTKNFIEGVVVAIPFLGIFIYGWTQLGWDVESTVAYAAIVCAGVFVAVSHGVGDDSFFEFLAHAIEVTDSSVRAVVAAPFDLVAVDNDEHHTTKHKAKRSKGASKSSRNDDEQLSLF